MKRGRGNSRYNPKITSPYNRYTLSINLHCPLLALSYIVLRLRVEGRWSIVLVKPEKRLPLITANKPLPNQEVFKRNPFAPEEVWVEAQRGS